MVLVERLPCPCPVLCRLPQDGRLHAAYRQKSFAFAESDFWPEKAGATAKLVKVNGELEPGLRERCNPLKICHVERPDTQNGCGCGEETEGEEEEEEEEGGGGNSRRK